jgi:DNA-binding NarL/FixJ family response regulator
MVEQLKALGADLEDARQPIRDSAMPHRMYLHKCEPRRAYSKQADALSSREQRILALVAEGQTNKQIAASLSLSDNTVRNYLSQIFQKLQVSHRADAVALYMHRPPAPGVAALPDSKAKKLR